MEIPSGLGAFPLGNEETTDVTSPVVMGCIRRSLSELDNQPNATRFKSTENAEGVKSGKRVDPSLFKDKSLLPIKWCSSRNRICGVWDLTYWNKEDLLKLEFRPLIFQDIK